MWRDFEYLLKSIMNQPEERWEKEEDDMNISLGELLPNGACRTSKQWIFLKKKRWFFGRFSAFYGQRSVTAAWATRSPWSILLISPTRTKTTRIFFLFDKLHNQLYRYSSASGGTCTRCAGVRIGNYSRSFLIIPLTVLHILRMININRNVESNIKQANESHCKGPYIYYIIKEEEGGSMTIDYTLIKY